MILETYNEKAKEKVAFLQIQNYCIESFENGQAVMADGAYQHVALDVRDIEEMYKKICEMDMKSLRMELSSFRFGIMV